MPDLRLILLAPITLLALAALVCPKPSLSAIFLLIQAGLIALFLGLYFAPGPIILLCLFCVPVLASNIYIEKCMPRHAATPKLNLLLGALLFLIFTLFFSRIKNLRLDLIKNNLIHQEINYDLLSIGGVIFIIFTVIICSFSVINLKNT